MAARLQGRRRKKLLDKLLTRDNYTCMLCLGQVDASLPREHDLAPTFDHIIPRSRGGSNEQTNLQIAHRKCNNERSSRPLPIEFSAYQVAYQALSVLKVGLGQLASSLHRIRIECELPAKNEEIDNVEGCETTCHRHSFLESGAYDESLAQGSDMQQPQTTLLHA